MPMESEQEQAATVILLMLISQKSIMTLAVVSMIMKDGKVELTRGVMAAGVPAAAVQV